LPWLPGTIYSLLIVGALPAASAGKETGASQMEISAISPVFSYDGQADRFCVIDQGWAALQAIGRRETTTDTPNLVAIYVTESPEREHNDDPATFGRIAALVRPDPMPHGHTVRNYPSGCLVLKRNQLVDRWPVGWPCTVAFISPYGGPFLRDVVWNALRISNYGDDFACSFC
jgi:hypothetical protein